MRLLLDTHVLLWALGGDDRLGPAGSALISDPASEVLASAASAWEIELKRALGRLAAPTDLEAALAASRIGQLPVTLRHVRGLADLPPHHTDPFDRLLIAQARSERLTLVSRDAALTAYDVDLLHL